jgi:2-keto-3-deoxy-L-fuconate dehydrogenase
MNQSLLGKRILVTQATSFMGPTLCEVLAQHGAIVIANNDALTEVGAAEAMVNAAGVVDVVVANLAISAPTSLATEASESE